MATYTKLRDGSWGLRGHGLKAGLRVSVTTKAGAVRTETVGRVLWTGEDGLALATIGGGGSGGSRTVCAECGRGGSLVADLEDGLMKHPRCCDIPPDGY